MTKNKNVDCLKIGTVYTNSDKINVSIPFFTEPNQTTTDTILKFIFRDIKNLRQNINYRYIIITMFLNTQYKHCIISL